MEVTACIPTINLKLLANESKPKREASDKWKIKENSQASRGTLLKIRYWNSEKETKYREDKERLRRKIREGTIKHEDKTLTKQRKQI